MIDIASDAIENIINSQTFIFKNIKKFRIVDESNVCRTLGVFLGLFKNMYNVEELWLSSPDSNICVLFEEFLPHMKHLKTLYWRHPAANAAPRFNANIPKCFEAIKIKAPKLTNIFVIKESIDVASGIFDKSVKINEITE